MTNFKKTLLVGTALVAVGGFAVGAQAADFTLTGATTWGAGDTAGAAADDNVDLDGFDLLINESDVTAVGDITDTGATPDGDVNIDANAGDGAGTVVTINSINLGTTTGDVLIESTEAGGAADPVAVTVTTDLTAATLSIVGGDGSATDHASLTIGGNLTAPAIALTNDGGGSTATLTLNGSAAQTVTGVISGDGTINVTNIGGTVTFAGDSTHTGALTVNGDDTADQTVVFTGDNASAIALGEGTGTETITATFSGETLDISGGITGGATETVNVNIQGGDTVNQSAGAWDVITTLAVSGSTTFDSDDAVTATDTTIASGSTVEQGAGLWTGDIANAGTLTLDGAGGVAGDITGTGTLNIDASATLTGNVAGSSADVATGQTLTFAGANEYSVTTTSLTGTGTLALSAAAQTVSGAITATADGDGAITVADGAVITTITGEIGTSSAAVATLTVAGVGANVVTTTKNLYIDAIVMNDADTLQFLGDGTAQTVSGTITDGLLAVGDGTTESSVTFEGAITGVAGLTVNDTSTAIFNEDAAVGAVSADAATIQVAAGKTLTGTTQTDADVTTWNIGVNKVAGAQTNGTVVFGDGIDLSVDTVNFVVAAGAQPLTVGASVLTDVFQGNAVSVVAGATVTDNSYLYGFELVGAVDNNVDVTITQENSIASAAANSANTNVGNVLLTTLSGSTNAEINAVQGNLAAASTASAVNEILEASIPDIAGGSVLAATVVNNISLGLTETRMASLRDGNMTGMSAGNMGEGLGMWGQVFGTTGEQDRREGIDGYEVDTYGLAVGIDTQNLAANTTLGLAFAYADTDVDSKNATNAKTEIDTYQIALYGEYEIDDRTWLTGQAAYASGDNDVTRTNVGGVVGSTATGDFDSDTWSLRAELGRDYAMDNGMKLTPSVLANYMYYDGDDYTETGAGGMSLVVDQDEVSIFELGLGLDASWLFQQADGAYVEPEVRVGYRYDLIGDEVESTNAFVGAPGTTFTTEGFDPAQSTFNIGGAVTYYAVNNWEFTANYDFEIKEDYDAHSGYLRAAYKF